MNLNLRGWRPTTPYSYFQLSDMLFPRKPANYQKQTEFYRIKCIFAGKSSLSPSRTALTEERAKQASGSDMAIIKKLEVAANVAIIVVACLLAVTLIKQHLWPASSTPNNSATNEREVTADLSRLNIDWATNKQTLLLSYRAPAIFAARARLSTNGLALVRAQRD